jgi:uncharacterized protein
MWLSKTERRRLARASRLGPTPVPTRMISNGEYVPVPQTTAQRMVATRLHARADHVSRKLGMSRRAFLKTASAITTALLAMNDVYGPFFAVDEADAEETRRPAALGRQFVVDAQTHHVRQSYTWEPILELRAFAQGRNPQRVPWTTTLRGSPPSLDDLKLEAFIRHVFLESDTAVAVLSGFTSDAKDREALTSQEIVASRNLVNRLAGSRRVLAHGLFWPGAPGNLEEMDRCATEWRVDSWKGYTVGDPLSVSTRPWRLDDEKVAYPAFERADRHGIRNICIHKGLLPKHAASLAGYASVNDVARAAKDWPNLNFIIYHAAFRPALDASAAVAELRSTGRIAWVTDLAEIAHRHRVTNVYAELGTTFASTVITFPEVAAAILGQLIAGLGADHVIWGTDSVWYGSPQWQIEAFRAFEIPPALRRQYGWAALGGPLGPTKSAILGLNSARLYGLDPHARRGPIPANYRDQLRSATDDRRSPRNDRYYGWVAPGPRRGARG